ncbi:hypothetical protein N7486_001118 [Penicillium sp. IBT 16267x]|nr:hypothetical protein N7486_001118 [Penicillium sp. IBT 16267x]
MGKLFSEVSACERWFDYQPNVMAADKGNGNAAAALAAPTTTIGYSAYLPERQERDLCGVIAPLIFNEQIAEGRGGTGIQFQVKSFCCRSKSQVYCRK